MISKQDFLAQTLNEINSFATRRNRGTDEQRYLLNDLERIEQLVRRAKAINESDVEEYTREQIEAINLIEFHDGIKAIIDAKEQS